MDNQPDHQELLRTLRNRNHDPDVTTRVESRFPKSTFVALLYNMPQIGGLARAIHISDARLALWNNGGTQTEFAWIDWRMHCCS
jgi:hypothetical protein